MQCTKCEYPLWNLKARQCPECGEPFLPSEREFVINSVRFCCPHCNQSYYGTGEKGHLVPSSFVCVKCAQPITMDEMVLLPAAGVAEYQTKVEQAPWLERDRIGRLRAWFATVFQGLFLPNRLIRGVPVESGAGQALWYAVVTSAIFAATSTVPIMLFIGLMAFAFGGLNQGGGLDFAIVAVSMFAGLWVSTLVLLGLWGLITHGMLLITGGAQHSIGRTFQAIGYSIGGAAFLAVPLFGMYLGIIPLIWWMVSAIIMITIGQGVHPGRAILATALTPVAVIVIVVGGFIALMMLGVSSARTTMVQMSQSGALAAQKMSSDLLTASDSNHGAYPAFALELAADDVMKLDQFVNDMSFTDASDIKFGSQALFDLYALSEEEYKARIADIAAMMPPDIVAHRIGDFVFTYHGMAPNRSDNALWVVVAAPPATLQEIPDTYAIGIVREITVVMADGSSVSHPVELFGAALEDQNRIREANSLPPLPDPRHITLEEPIVRENGEREAYADVSP